MEGAERKWTLSTPRSTAASSKPGTPPISPIPFTFRSVIVPAQRRHSNCGAQLWLWDSQFHEEGAVAVAALFVRVSRLRVSLACALAHPHTHTSAHDLLVMT